jgi:hypothetical protein
MCGKVVKKSLNTRDWSIAAATVHEWEAAREMVAETRNPRHQGSNREELEDSARHLAAPTIRKRRELL